MMFSVRLVIVLMLGVSCLGCENSVDPIIGEERPFTIWGLLDVGADTQKVRVFTIEEYPGVDRPFDIDAEVISTNLTTGEVRRWNHRIKTYEDGTSGHIFWSAFRPEHDHRYRLDIVRSDGERSVATVTVPPEVEVEIEQNPLGATAFAFIYGDVLNLINPEVRYEATNLPPVHAWPPGTPVHPQVFWAVELPYIDKGERIEGGWKFKIDLAADFPLVQDEFRKRCLITGGAPDIALRRVEFHFLAGDSAWFSPSGTFDPDVLVEPGTMSNVENGYGFFGAGRIFAQRWTPPQPVREKIGYKTDRPCSVRPAPIRSCMEPPIPCWQEGDENPWGDYF